VMSAEVAALSKYVDALNRAEQGAVPTLTLEGGIAGIGYASFLLGREYGDASLIMASYQMMLKMLTFIDEGAAFEPEHANVHFELVQSHFQGSLFYGPAGYWFTLAMLASNVGDRSTATMAVNEFLSRCSGPHTHAEFLFGSAGVLWAAGHLLRQSLSHNDLNRVVQVSSMLLAETWGNFCQGEKYRSIFGMGELGFAHGTAGILYCVLVFCTALECALPDGFIAEMEELACLAAVSSRGTSWPVAYPDEIPLVLPGVRESWCNGAAGFVPLWNLAHDVFGGNLYRDLTLKTAAFITGVGPGAKPTLCCGLAGHMVAFGYAARIEPAEKWGSFIAQILQALSPSHVSLNSQNHGLFKGVVGALLGGTAWL